MKIILCDINSEMTKAWNEVFVNDVDIKILNCDFRDLPFELIDDNKLVLCSAGNSYGIMGGGLDLAIAQRFSGVEEAVRSAIQDIYSGELPVGHSVMIPLLEESFVALIYTPTMRAPIRLINGHNVYLATRSAMRCYNALCATYVDTFINSTLVLPGFGGLCGRLHPLVVARSMKLAYDRQISGYMPSTHRQMTDENRLIGSICSG